MAVGNFSKEECKSLTPSVSRMIRKATTEKDIDKMSDVGIGTGAPANKGSKKLEDLIEREK